MPHSPSLEPLFKAMRSPKAWSIEALSLQNFAFIGQGRVRLQVHVTPDDANFLKNISLTLTGPRGTPIPILSSFPLSTFGLSPLIPSVWQLFAETLLRCWQRLLWLNTPIGQQARHTALSQLLARLLQYNPTQEAGVYRVRCVHDGLFLMKDGTFDWLESRDVLAWFPYAPMLVQHPDPNDHPLFSVKTATSITIPASTHARLALVKQTNLHILPTPAWPADI